MKFIKKNAVWLTLIPVILIMVFIFIMSHQTGEVSKATSGRISTFLINIFFPDFSSFDILKQTEIRHNVVVFLRKFAHFAEFAALGFFLMLHINTIKQKFGGSRYLWTLSLIIGVLYAISDEVHQIFVSERGPMITDVLLDSAGVLFGTALLILIWNFISKKINNKKLKEQ